MVIKEIHNKIFYAMHSFKFVSVSAKVFGEVKNLFQDVVADVIIIEGVPAIAAYHGNKNNKVYNIA